MTRRINKTKIAPVLVNIPPHDEQEQEQEQEQDAPKPSIITSPPKLEIPHHIDIRLNCLGVYNIIFDLGKKNLLLVQDMHFINFTTYCELLLGKGVHNIGKGGLK
jgi:hypothetical protein